LQKPLPGHRRAALAAVALTLVLASGHALAQDTAANQEAPSNEELARRIAALAQELDDAKLGEVAAPLESEHGLGPAASKIYRVDQGVSIGGYGEANYMNFAPEREDGVASGRQDQIDYLRQVLYLGYKFDDHVLFNTEIEFEHASTGKSGEVSVEFAYLDFLLDPAANARVGLLLVPMGFVNELHEPTTYFGVNRPDVERQIIPTTWRANGAGIFGEPERVVGLSYRAYVIESLQSVGAAERFSSSGLRNGRQSGSQASMDDIAGVVRVDGSRAGFTLGASAFFGNTGQGAVDTDGAEIAGFTTIYEGHVEWQRRGAVARALFSRADVDDVAAINLANGIVAGGNGGAGSVLIGWYVEAGYDVMQVLSPGSRFKLLPFARYLEIDTQHEVPDGFADDPAQDRTQLTLGASFFPHSQVVLKADWMGNANAAETGVDQWNFGIGFLF
jgi:hypothetical protein